MSISSGVTFVPRSLLYFSGSNGILFSVFFSGYTSTIPPTTSPAPNSSINAHARLMAASALFGSRPFSNLPDASVRSPSLFAESLIFVPSKHAASNKISFTSSVIFEFSPPMIPAIPTGFSASQIMRMFSSSLRS